MFILVHVRVSHDCGSQKRGYNLVHVGLWIRIYVDRSWQVMWDCIKYGRLLMELGDEQLRRVN